MSFDATITSNHDAGSAERATQLALRWVYPDPKRAPTWLTRSLVIGRDASADVIFDRGQVSRRHAEIERCGPVILLRDLDSKNGVNINGKRIRSQELNAGDVVRLGDVVAVVVAATPETDLGFRDFGSGVFGGHRHAQIVEELQALAASQLCIVLQGATGTGKDRFAALIHSLSQRNGPLISVNCAVYTQNLAAAELFGYRKGAFTGADHSSPGHIRAAQGGTLFLDELPELPLDVQPMLLRAIENRELIPLGESRAQSIDVRFVSATQTPLSEAVERGRFRADLRARLEGGVVHLPALRECRELIPELFRALLRRHTQREHEPSASFVEALCLRDFSLNIRELDTLAQRIALQPDVRVALLGEVPLTTPPSRTLARETLEPAASPSERSARAQLDVPGRPASPYSDEELQQLQQALARVDGNVTRAAQELGITRARAYRMLERLGRK
jgi:DNA-binding NtrC family response regulator